MGHREALSSLSSDSPGSPQVLCKQPDSSEFRPPCTPRLGRQGLRAHSLLGNEGLAGPGRAGGSQTQAPLPPSWDKIRALGSSDKAFLTQLPCSPFAHSPSSSLHPCSLAHSLDSL